MVISRTPYRISFFGGGTDYPAWYRQHGGGVLAATINKYCYLTCRYLPPFFEHRTRVMYSIIEMCQKVEEIQHPAVRETLRYLKIDRGMEIHHDGDLPSRSGMGSSSAFTVGLLHALLALKGQIVSKKQLADRKHSSRTGGAQGDRRLPGPGVRRLRRRQPDQFPAERRFLRPAAHPLARAAAAS